MAGPVDLGDMLTVIQTEQAAGLRRISEAATVVLNQLHSAMNAKLIEVDINEIPGVRAASNTAAGAPNPGGGA